MYLKRIINIILALIVIIVFWYGFVTIFNIGMIEKNQIKPPNTKDNTIYLSVETRINEIESVRTLVQLSFILGVVVIIKLASELLVRKK